MSKVKLGNGKATVAIEETVAEAVEALGYFEMDAVMFIAHRMIRLWGSKPRHFEKDGELIKPLRNRPRYEMSREVWERLSEKGRADPSRACEATYLRVYFNVTRTVRHAELDAMKASRRRWRWAQLQVDGKTCCAVAAVREGRYVSLREPVLGIFSRPAPFPPLPLEGCTAEWCACSWRPDSERV